MEVLLNTGKSGILPNNTFLGLQFITGEPNLINPIYLPVFFSLTASFNTLPGILRKNRKC